MNNKIAAIIVAYFPDNRLKRSIDALLRISAIGTIIVVDNTDDLSRSIEKFDSINNVITIQLGLNKGIAYAQNKGIEIASSLGFNWILTLDQDTIINESLIIKYCNYIENYNNNDVAIIGTDYYDIGSKQNKWDNNEIIETNETISSGCLLNTTIFSKLGNFKSYYFIDQVDNEFCFRVRQAGYKIIILPGSDIEHRLGHTIEKNLLGFKFFLYNQPPIRTFYRTRNLLYFTREYLSLTVIKSTIFKLFKDFSKLSMENNSYQKYKCFIKGIYHGIFDKLIFCK